MNDLIRIDCTLLRGGTSKGAFFLDKDLPANLDERYKLITRIMGSPDLKQIDGIGGATSVTTKVAIINPSKREGIDVDYKFVQVMVDEARVDDKPTCGNVLTAVGIYALEKGLVQIEDGETTVTVYDVNTGATIAQTIQTPSRVIQYKGDMEIAGVPGTASPIKLFFKNITGGKAGHYLPTGNTIDTFEGIETTCLDISMPVVFVRATDLGITGYESPDELDQNKAMFETLEKVREAASHAMGLGSAKGNVIPKIAAVSPAKGGGDICVRYFTPSTAHPALAVSASFCIATGSFIKGTLLHELNPQAFEIKEDNVLIEHPSGIMDVGVNFPTSDISEVEGKSIRTARVLFKGEVFA